MKKQPSKTLTMLSWLELCLGRREWNGKIYSQQMSKFLNLKAKHSQNIQNLMLRWNPNMTRHDLLYINHLLRYSLLGIQPIQMPIFAPNTQQKKYQQRILGIIIGFGLLIFRLDFQRNDPIGP